MGRKRKLAENYILDFPDDLILLPKDSEPNGVMCKICKIEIKSINGKKHRIMDHLESAGHKTIKGSQLGEDGKKADYSLMTKKKNVSKKSKLFMSDHSNSDDLFDNSDLNSSKAYKLGKTKSSDITDASSFKDASSEKTHSDDGDNEIEELKNIEVIPIKNNLDLKVKRYTVRSKLGKNNQKAASKSNKRRGNTLISSVSNKQKLDRLSSVKNQNLPSSSSSSSLQNSEMMDEENNLTTEQMNINGSVDIEVQSFQTSTHTKNAILELQNSTTIEAHLSQNKVINTAFSSRSSAFDSSFKKKYEIIDASILRKNSTVDIVSRKSSLLNISSIKSSSPVCKILEPENKPFDLFNNGLIELSNIQSRLLLENLTETFNIYKKEIASRISSSVSVIVLEVSEILDRPALAVLIGFYDRKTGVPQIALANLDVFLSTNSISVSTAVTSSLKMFNKDWSSVIGLCSDSSIQIKKAHEELKAGFNHELLKVNDPFHLLMSVSSSAVEIEAFADVDFLVTHIPQVFKYASKITQEYFSICTNSGVNEKDLKLPTRVICSNWLTWFEAASEILQRWPCIVKLFESVECQKALGQKGIEIREKLAKRLTVYTKLLFLVENLRPVNDLVKRAENKELFIHKLYHLFLDVTMLFEERASPDFSDYGSRTQVALNMADSNRRENLQHDFATFYYFCNTWWKEMMDRFIDNTLMGAGGLWECCMMLDPYQKMPGIHRLPEFLKLRALYYGQLPDEEKLTYEFNNYLNQSLPSHQDIMQYWKKQEDILSNISFRALQLLSIPVSLLPVESKFTQVRKIIRAVQILSDEPLSKEALKKLAFIHFNKSFVF